MHKPCNSQKMDYNNMYNDIDIYIFNRKGEGFMMIIFLIVNTITFLCTSLGILMFSNNLKRISRSIDIYLDPKAYKPESEVRLISSLWDKYSDYNNKESVDLDALIASHFYANKIGKFKVTSIETLAKKGKGLLWFGIISMVIVESLTTGLGVSNLNSVLIIISAGLGVVLGFYEIYSDVEVGKQKLFVAIKNSLNNEYPQFKISKKEKEEVSLLLTKIEKLEEKIKINEAIKKEQEEKKKQAEALQEEDIVQILKSFDLFT